MEIAGKTLTFNWRIWMKYEKQKMIAAEQFFSLNLSGKSSIIPHLQPISNKMADIHRNNQTNGLKWTSKLDRNTSIQHQKQQTEVDFVEFEQKVLDYSTRSTNFKQNGGYSSK